MPLTAHPRYVADPHVTVMARHAIVIDASRGNDNRAVGAGGPRRPPASSATGAKARRKRDRAPGGTGFEA
jgi:hypothetical protein